MLVLDTNILSEALRPEPNAAFRIWLRAQPPASLFTTAITKAEIKYGIAILPEGKRRSTLLTAATLMFEDDFNGRVLPFDSDAADVYAAIAAQRRLAGQPISEADGQIAAIARSRGGRVATRNVRDFINCGVDLVNPWEAKIQP
jgi:predicted nucleic acid-binding protein